MGIYRTAQGKKVDMSSLAAKNEKVRAVGNMSVNARGDTIDSTGKVVVPVTKKVGERYQRTVSNRAANLLKAKEDTLKPVESAPKPDLKLDIKDELDLLEDDDLSEFEVEVEVEVEEVQKPKKK